MSWQELNEVLNRINKIMWFNSYQSHFDYFLVKGTRQENCLSPEDIMILQNLILKKSISKGYELYGLADAKTFVGFLKSGLRWAADKQGALIFKYRPSEEVKNANRNFEKCKEEYIKNDTPENYLKMYDAFSYFYDVLGE